jgi:type III restriction enzyme
MILKDSQKKVVKVIDSFFRNWKNEFLAYTDKASRLKTAGMDEMIKDMTHPVKKVYESIDEYRNFSDIPENFNGPYPRMCVKVPTGGGKTLLGVETIRLFHEGFLEKKTGLVLWIVHSEPIYKQTIEKLKDKHNPYRQKLDQISGGRTLILEKTDSIRYQDTQENLCVLMLMIQSANRETKENLKIFRDSGIFMDFFPYEHEQEKTDALLEKIPTLEIIEDTLFGKRQIITSLGNVVRVCNPLFIIDEFHKIYTDAQKRILDDLNPKCIIGLSATPKTGMNILVTITGMELHADQMIKLPINVRPEVNDNWRELVGDVKEKREELEKIAIKHKESKGDYIRPIALLQAERTGKEQRDGIHVHANDIKDYLVQLGIPVSQIAIKSSYVDELKDEVLMSQDCDIRYIITKQALMEGWDCPFTYVLGVVPRSSSTTALTQLVGRVLRQPYTKRTGIPQLDECYTFFNHADADELLRGIKKTLEADGLGDIVDTVKGSSGPSGKSLLYKDFPIQEYIKKQYPESLYLPVWHIKDKKEVRLLSYQSDIVSKIRWENIDISKIVDSLQKTIKDHIVRGVDYKYALGETYLSEVDEYEKEYIEGGDEYIISQILSEYIYNPFTAYSFVKNILISLEKKGISRQEIESDFGYIAHELVLFTKHICHEQEEKIFNELAQKGSVFLGISKEGGYQIPERYYAPAKEDEDDKSILVPYKQDKKSLHLAVDFVTMNNLEKEIVDELKQQDKVLWWMRNKVQPGAYKIQAWRKNRIYPDFIVAKQNDEGKLELIYIIESKGDQLTDNLDTKYKQLVFQKMTESSVINNIKQFDSYEFNLIPQSETKRKIRELFQ